MSSNNTYAYLYRWVHIPSGKWYVGSRTKAGCHPDDGYICSSKIVKPLIQENASEWQRYILCIGDPAYIYELEISYLQAINAKDDDMSFNLSNGYKHFSVTGRPSHRKGKKIGPWSEERKQAQSQARRGKYTGRTPWNKGRPMDDATKQKLKDAWTDDRKAVQFTEEACARRAQSRVGRQLSDETKQKISEANKGRSHPRSPETREKIRQALLARPPVSEETKQKISQVKREKARQRKLQQELALAEEERSSEVNSYLIQVTCCH